MTSRLAALSIGAVDPPRLTRFWAAALGYAIEIEAGSVIGLASPDARGLRIVFRPFPEAKAAENALHLDLSTTSVEDQRAFARSLTELGASPIDIGHRPDERQVVLADPEGNEFCVLEPGNSFVDNSGRLGSITCDGSRRVGQFWSAVLGWDLVWDQDGETAIRAPDGTGPFITWGPPVPDRATKNRLHLDIERLHLDIEPAAPADCRSELDRLLALGATRVDPAQGTADHVIMLDSDGNEFWLLTSR